ncbi:hypothetical protein KUW17_23150 [Leisingera aquaemixtae]|uniref:DUF5906 domain-containing protein n=1 Tax=Leisingera aquaemixtae TaxID=1396826 RepID=UPI001C94D83D|nr:DUF5906 domain-containing protein [Leisingera aquaemixtae]MBY6069645.1 hypothetical protein [Leisingera aquaemixtae]
MEVKEMAVDVASESDERQLRRRNTSRHRRKVGANEDVLPTPATEAEVVEDAKDQPEEENPHEIAKATLCMDLASKFVRKEGRFYRIEDPSSSMSATDLKRVYAVDLPDTFPDIEMTDELWRDVVQNAVEKVHSNRSQTIAVWDGRVECNPGLSEGIIWHKGSATINSWIVPAYRNLGIQETDCALFDELLERIFVQPTDRGYFKDWLSSGLQNERLKPGWAFLLYSQNKGTGKSTLLQTSAQLFGAKNSITVNGLQKLTSRFNQTLMSKKFVGCEEVKLKPGTDAGNAIKALITESNVAVEGKGKEVTQVNNVTSYVMTTNHYPHWIEPDDRRWYVADANHSGHASGPDAADFQSFMTHFHEQMSRREVLARLYNALLEHKQSNSFNPRSMNMAAIDTPIMRRLSAGAGEVLQQELVELLAGRDLRAVAQTTLRRLFTVELKANPNRITHFMNELGWHAEKVKWGGADYARVVWVHPDYQVANGRVIGPDGYDQPIDKGEDGVEII